MKESENKVVTPFVSQAELRSKQAKARPSSEDIHVGPNTHLSGGFSTNGMMIVDGRVDSADVEAERLVLSHIGELEGTVSVQRAEISGNFNGNLIASDEVIVRPTARIAGNVRCQKLVIHRGARIECTFSCSPDGTEEATSGSEASPTRTGASWLTNVHHKRDRRLVLTGAGCVLALIGAGAMLMSFKALIS